MIKQDTLENQVNIVFLGVGSNLGNKKINIEKAKYLLEKSLIKIIKCSLYYKTKSWPNINYPSYYNIVIKAKTLLTASELFIKIKKIEKSLGRVKSQKNEPRTCDIDIIDFNGKNLSFKINNNRIQIPHIRAIKRNFVLIPLFEINKKWLHPKNKKKISDLINKLDVNSLSSIKQI